MLYAKRIRFNRRGGSYKERVKYNNQNDAIMQKAIKIHYIMRIYF